MSTRQIAVTGMLSAIVILLGVTHLGFIPFFGTAITIMNVPVIIGAVLEGPWTGAIIGLLFGIFSLLQAFLAPTGPGDLFFRDPLISVLPRLFIGPVAWLVYRAVKPVNEIVAVALAAVAGTLTNTVLVLGMLVLRQYIPLEVALVVAVTNLPLELVATVIITVAVVSAWKRLEYGRKGADL